MVHEIVVGLGLGDESKGSAVDWLCATRDVKAVVRFNGGAQAAHNVIQPDGRHHTFAQFGSGTFHNVPTHLSQHVLVNPFNLIKEAAHLESLGVVNPFALLTVAENALLVSPYHIAANRVRERSRGGGRHGSTGQGIGDARYFALTNPALAPRVGDMFRPHLLNKKLGYVRDFLEEDLGRDLDVKETPLDLAMQYDDLLRDTHLQIVGDGYVNLLLDSGDCVFEGAQGVLLDEDLGFHPHTTWTCTTQRNARAILAGRPAHVYGLTRTYHTRHGAGPLPSEHGDLADFPEPHNGTGEFQGSWRVGDLDLSLLSYAVRANGGVDDIIVSHCDLIGVTELRCTMGYDRQTTMLRPPRNMREQEVLTSIVSSGVGLPFRSLETQDDVSEVIRLATGVTPSVFSYGPTWMDKQSANVPALT